MGTGQGKHKLVRHEPTGDIETKATGTSRPAEFCI